ncbi:MAG: ABC transporter ATP-binding protein [Promethearchaeota archaeon]
MNYLLRVEHLSKTYFKKNGSSREVLKNISFSLKKGECFVIIGPNGSGKTTLLRILGLLEPPSGGNMYYDGINLRTLPKKELISYRRKFSFVRQKPVVLDTTVYNNIAFGLKVRDFNKKEIDSAIKEIIKLVGLEGMEKKNARSLSGGEMQRVAIAMNFVVSPEIYLLDEVSANLDPQNVVLLNELINTIKQNAEKTIILSTHDKLEAIKFADKIGVLNNGSFTQVDSPSNIFTNPKDEYTARFVGYENIFVGMGKVEPTSGLNKIKINDLTIVASIQKEGEVKACIRPESIVISKNPQKDVSFRNNFKGIIREIRDLGNICHVFVQCYSEQFLVSITNNARKNLNLNVGSQVYISFKATDITIL